MKEQENDFNDIGDGRTTATGDPIKGQVRGVLSTSSQGGEGKSVASDAVRLGAAQQPDEQDPIKVGRNGKPIVRRTRSTLSKVRTLPEIHSGMLTDSCPRRVQLRIEGKATNEAPTALYRGVLVGAVLERLHMHNWIGNHFDPLALVNAQAIQVRHNLESEGRILTDAVLTNTDEIHAEVASIVKLYDERFGSRFKKAHLIGCELPCRMSIGKVQFASHLDLMFVDTVGDICGVPGALVIWDWKWRQETPTRAYLSRNMQLALYWLMAQDGAIQIDSKFGIWQEFRQAPVVSWCHLPGLKPFARATVSKDDDGIEQQYAKGDFRPERSIVRDCGFRYGMQSFAKNEILKRVELMRLGIDVAIPDPVGCHLCDCEPWCRRLDTAELGTKQGA